mmetsp:Transcript_25846/g.63308  ORF Transcript_25846/g.63308 Transcript_25846/m.63308 type:complete len:231 (-) Transcript_25846:248-940(-)
MSSDGETHSGDEQYAKDMQLAYNLQAKEEQRAHNLKKKKRRELQTALHDGYSQSKLSADHMLFIRCLIDDRQVDLLVDTGASVSAISVDMVQKLHLESKWNHSISGNARGVGSSNILGIVEHVDCMIGHVEFRLFFMVLEGNMPYCILGLDQMRRFRCNVDLDENVLVFGGKGGVSVPFLPQEEAAIVAKKMMSSSHHQEQQQQQQQQQDQSQDNNEKKKGGMLKSLFRS